MSRPPSKSESGRRRPLGRPPLAEVAQHRDALLDVATTVFMEHGYEAASLNVIAHRAGASKMTLYRLFPSKAELFVAVMMRRISAGLIQLDQLIQEHRGSTERLLDDLAFRFLNGAIDHDQVQLGRVILHDGHRFPELASAYWAQSVGGVTQSLSKYFKSASVRSALRIPNADEAADVFLSLVLGLTPLAANMNVLPADVGVWTRKRARDRVRAFLKIYAVGDEAPQAVSARTGQSLRTRRR
jgi:TetR/AcrR family transcriptional repressor of mexJK operon